MFKQQSAVIRLAFSVVYDPAALLDSAVFRRWRDRSEFRSDQPISIDEPRDFCHAHLHVRVRLSRRLSVCLSIRPSYAGNASKLLTVGIMRFSPSGGLGTQVFCDQLSHPRSQGNPLARSSNKTKVGKNGGEGDFRPINYYISETVEDRQLHWKTNRKSQTGFR